MSTDDRGCFSCCLLLFVLVGLLSAIALGMTVFWNEVVAKLGNLPEINFVVSLIILLALTFLSMLFTKKD